MGTETDNRRREPRLRKLNLVSVAPFDEQGFAGTLAMGRTLDISRGGIRLELNQALPLRTTVNLSLGLGDDVVEIRGTVCFLEALDGQTCAMGIQFRDMSPETRDALDGYLRSLGR